MVFVSQLLLVAYAKLTRIEALTMLTLHCALRPLLAGGFKGKKGAKRLDTKLFGENGHWIQIVGHRLWIVLVHHGTGWMFGK
ncbi:hypothetical protein EDD15DRAFT_2234564 [Pisolithus albus]|nr:hypothetical protein EDD15DRAFT_2234564 [Pisolithus albus]